MKSKTKIEEQTTRKSNSELIETLRLAKKNEKWMDIATILSSPRRNKIQVNLDKIGKEEGDVLIPGKVLSQGETKSKKVVAFAFSEKAKEKILKAGGKVVYIMDEIKQNKDMKNLKILK